MYIYSTENESIINNLLKQKAPGQNGFPGEFYQTFKEKTIAIFYNLFQKIEAQEMLPNSFYEVSITLKPKPSKHMARK